MAARRTRIFIDYWNFQLAWNVAAKQSKCDWRALPPAILAATASVLGSVGLADPLDLEETLLYASVDPVDESKLRGWLTTYIERLPSWRVTIRERKPQPRRVHCRHCNSTFAACPDCHQTFAAKPEKGVDAAIVTEHVVTCLAGRLRYSSPRNQRCRLRSRGGENSGTRIKGDQRGLGRQRTRIEGCLLGIVRSGLYYCKHLPIVDLF